MEGLEIELGWAPKNIEGAGFWYVNKGYYFVALGRKEHSRKYGWQGTLSNWEVVYGLPKV